MCFLSLQPTYNLHFFVNRQGLRGKGRPVKSLQDNDVSLQEIEDVLGPRFDKNGWKITRNVSPEVQRQIKDLYRRVFRRESVLNDTISLEFARGVVAEIKEIQVNWAAYAVAAYNKRRSLQDTRRARAEQLRVPHSRKSQLQERGVSSVSLEGELSEPPSSPTRGSEFSAISAVSLQSLPLLSSLSPSLPFDSTRPRLPPTPNSRPRMDSVSSSKRCKGVTKHEFGLSSVKESNVKTIERVQCLLATAQVGFIAAKEGLRVLSIEKEERELDLRRARLMCSDRKSISEFAHSEFLKVKAALDSANQYVDRWTNSSPNLSHCSPTSSSDDSVAGRISGLEDQLRLEERNSKHALLKLEEIESQCARLAESLDACTKRYNSVFRSQTCMEQFQHLVVNYLGLLKYGTVQKFSPSPIERPKEFHRESNIVYVENCPVCGEDFHCNDIAVTSCGHCYHPFCLISHSSKSNLCIAQFCDKEFDADWRLSWGFPQPPTDVPTPDVTHGSPFSGGMSGKFLLYIGFLFASSFVLCYTSLLTC